MKRYIADALTAIRFLSAVALMVLIYSGKPHEWAFWVFVVGQLTDAFDGIAARRWPFDPQHTPRYRRYAELYDMVVDVLLGVVSLVYVTLRINIIAGAIIAAVAIETGIVVELLVWGRLFGSPERYYPDYLWCTNRQLAHTVILIRRRLYLVAIVTVLVILLCATSYSVFCKLLCLGIGVIAGIILLIIKKNRLREIKTK